jgi:hypothetical protein
MMTTGDEAVIIPCQHRAPCHDCPWRKKSISGWLGELTAQEWIQAAHGEAKVDCHALSGVNSAHQCAGLAIYRSNICKKPRDQSILVLPPNTVVFQTPDQFLTHHTSCPKN